MKTVVRVFLVLAVLFPNILSAQNRISGISIGSGQDPISSGISAAVRFESRDSARYGEFVVQNEQAWLVYGKQWHGKLSGFATASAGHFQGAPWVGPYAALSWKPFQVAGQDISFNTFHWPVLFFANEPRHWEDAKTKNPEDLSIGYLGSFGVSWGPIAVNYATLDFLHEKINSLPSVTFELPLAETIAGKVKSNISYTWNTNDKHAMYFMGITFSPRK